jgi:hypothetical protein
VLVLPLEPLLDSQWDTREGSSGTDGPEPMEDNGSSMLEAGGKASSPGQKHLPMERRGMGDGERAAPARGWKEGPGSVCCHTGNVKASTARLGKRKCHSHPGRSLA